MMILRILLVIIFSINLCFSQEGNYFKFVQLKYDGKCDPYPEAWQDILEFITTTTTIKPLKERKLVTLDDEELFSYPYLFILGTESFPGLSDKDCAVIRRYLSNGGMIFAEDSSGIKGSAFDSSFRKEIAKAFPESKLKKLPFDHPLYRAYYLLRKVGGRRLTNNYMEGIDISGRTALIYSQNDLIGAWAKDRLGNYLWHCLPGEETQRFEAQKLTLNLIMYFVTGTYKSDAVHKPYIQEKLGR
ncbi:MAG: DUF4159 domain-containing protein [Elusimicrobia bacterium]|nr:DUF4159 domain-containing protein [Candidatus Liberimonas magnetica]